MDLAGYSLCRLYIIIPLFTLPANLSTEIPFRPSRLHVYLIGGGSEISAPTGPLAGFKGPTSKGGEWRVREGKGKIRRERKK